MEDNFDVSGFVKDIIKVALKKDKQRITKKKWYNDNKEKKRIANKNYHDNNKEKLKEKQKQYRQTPNFRKSNRISNWKIQGIITDDYEALYNHYLKTAYCDICRVELTYDRYPTATTKCVDHDHSITDAPNFRNILCQSCNIKRK
mgnify:CR=1 FL=1|tara:strand:- start:1263 stop:1697 length:435 start_codon:yes stop_codon:yes gene_type:complete